MAAKRRPQQRDELVASYLDPAGRRHRIVFRDQLVLDLCQGRKAVLVAELAAEEGVDQARAAVYGGEFDPGYLARAHAGERPLGARLDPAEARARQLALEAAEAEAGEPDGDERLAA